MRTITTILLSLSLFVPFFAVADINLKQQINKDYGYLESLYHYLHRNPELSLHEKNTAKRLAGELGKIGFKITEAVGGARRGCRF